MSRVTLDDVSAPPAASTSRKLTAIALLACGVALYVLAMVLGFPEERKHWLHGIVLPILAVAAVGVAPIRGAVAGALDRCRNPSDRQRRGMTLIVWVAASAYLLLTAVRQRRDLNFRVQDERMFLLQIQQMARGKLWLPPHPLADFFQSIYLFARPVYGSMYFPGASIFYVPAAWLHVPVWIVSILICGAVVAMTYRVVTELTDAVWGGLAALLVVGVTTVRSVSLLVHSYMPMALLGLLLVWAWLHWRRERKLGWAAALGAIAGWAAITRPLDAICFAAPVALAMLMDLRGAGARRAMGTALIAIACAAPFLAMQLAIDRAYTGRWLQTPVQKYEELYWPGLEFGFRPRVLPGEHRVATELPQFRDIHAYFVKTFFAPAATRGGVASRYLLVFEYGMAQPLLLVLVPAGLLGLWDRRRRWALWAAGLILPLAYLGWVQFIRHYARYYCTVVSPVLAFAAVLGARQVVRAFPERRKFVSVWLAGAILVLAAMSLPELGAGKDRTNSSEPMQNVDRWARRQRTAALVFFRYPAGDPNAWRHEQVYNVEAAEIDEQRVVRAQDLGERDIELVQYYAERQPGRVVYRFENGMKEPKAVGTAREIAGKPELLRGTGE